MKSQIVTLFEDENGETVLPLPESLFDGDEPWFQGDTLTWKVEHDQVTIVNDSWNDRRTKRLIAK